MNLIEKYIKKKYPNYDFNRYSFQAGDCVETLDGALVIIEYSAIEYVNAFVIKRSMKFRERGEQRIYLSDLPNIRKGEFVNKDIKVSESIFWKPYMIVHLERGDMTVLLLEEVKHQGFYAYVLSSENSYYLNTRVYVENPWKEYCLE